ncbi:MAG: 50S ribosomal protein L25 [Patescibacteria group bacterium]
MQTITLSAQGREKTGKQSQAVRAEGFLPAVVYGRGTESKPISVAYGAFEKAYRQAGESTLVDLVIEGSGAVKTLIQDVQKDPVSDKMIHVDFYAVTMTEKLTAEIPLKFVGVAGAVKELGGTLVKNVSEVEVRCLPGDLVHEIEVPLDSLATFEDTITIAAIVRPKGIEILGAQDTIIATVMPPMTEEEMKKLDEKPVEADVSTIAKIETKKKEDEETAKK